MNGSVRLSLKREIVTVRERPLASAMALISQNASDTITMHLRWKGENMN